MARAAAEEAVGVFAWMVAVAFIVAAFWGWVANVVAIVGTVSDPITGMFVLRCFGVIFAPLGAVLGFF